MKKIILCIWIFLISLFIYSEFVSDDILISATVVDHTDDSLTVSGVDPFDPRAAYIVHSDFPVLAVNEGDTVFITYSGKIAESYPPQLVGVTQIETLETIFSMVDVPSL